MRCTALFAVLLFAAPAAAHDDRSPPRAPPGPAPAGARAFARPGSPRIPLTPAPASAPSRARPGTSAAPFVLLGGRGPERPDTTALREIRGLLEALRLDGWLLTDLRGDNPTALDLVRPARPAERRWFYLVPARGEPTLLAHVGDAAAFEGVAGRTVAYASFRDVVTSLKAALKGRPRVAMEIGGSLALPCCRLDATVADAVRAAGVKVVSSGDLRLARARWDEAARAQHLLAVHHLGRVRDEAIAFIVARVGAGRPPSEVEVEKLMLRSLRARGLETEAPPTVAVGAHSAIPAYLATTTRTGRVRPEEVVLLRIAGRMKVAGAPYASLTHVAFVGARVPDKVQQAYAAARAAGDAALVLIRARQTKGEPLRGHEVDAAVRQVLVRRGLGERILHPAGHALEPRFPGSALALDDYDSRDERLVQKGLALRLAPGVYFAGEFGVRAERNVFLGPHGPEETVPGQPRVPALFGPPPSELLELE